VTARSVAFKGEPFISGLPDTAAGVQAFFDGPVLCAATAAGGAAATSAPAGASGGCGGDGGVGGAIDDDAFEFGAVAEIATAVLLPSPVPAAQRIELLE